MGCDYCHGATDHDTIAHMTPAAAIRAARDAEGRGDTTRALQWYEVSRKLSAAESRKLNAVKFGR